MVERTRPEPWQVGQGFSITVPAPPQRVQGWLIEKNPWLSDVTPRPLQTGQIVGDVPTAAPEPWQVGQALALSTGTFTVTPREGVLERQADLSLDVAAAARGRRTGRRDRRG